MFAALFSRRVVIAVLVLYGLTLSLAMAAPLLNAKTGNFICTSTGFKVLPQETPTDRSTNHHTLDCALCVPMGIAPSPVFLDAAPPTHTLSYATRSIPAARLASLVSAPLPARGPPEFSFSSI
ncbi:MAG: DUF2946 domain-containing protein [Undibacterium sp.]|nr:DUF2946 domain-containing protein [Undibacterium sp.]